MLRRRAKSFEDKEVREDRGQAEVKVGLAKKEVRIPRVDLDQVVANARLWIGWTVAARTIVEEQCMIILVVGGTRLYGKCIVVTVSLGSVAALGSPRRGSTSAGVFDEEVVPSEGLAIDEEAFHELLKAEELRKARRVEATKLPALKIFTLRHGSVLHDDVVRPRVVLNDIVEGNAVKGMLAHGATITQMQQRRTASGTRIARIRSK